MHEREKHWGLHSEYPWDRALNDALFLERHFPFKMKVLFPLVKRYLSLYHAALFFAEAKERLWGDFSKEFRLATGLQLSWNKEPISNSGPRYYAYTATLSLETSVQSRGYGQSIRSSNEALSKAIGECLERYALSSVLATRSHVTSVSDMKHRGVSLESGAFYLSWQKKNNQKYITREELPAARLSWVPAESFLGYGTKFVPTQKVFLGEPLLDEQVLSQSTSNGAGGGFDRTSANISAICELVERDSFMCHWLLKISPKRIKTDSVRIASLQPLLDRAKIFNTEVYFLDVTTVVGIPCVSTVLVRRDRNGRRRIGVGAAAGWSPEKLFVGSLIEAFQVANNFSLESEEGTSPLWSEGSDPFSGSIDRASRLSLWRGGAFDKHISFFLEGEEITFEQFSTQRRLENVPTKREELRNLKEIFRQLRSVFGEGYHPYIYSFSNACLSTSGYFVSRAIIPSLYPLYLNESMATLDISSLSHWKETLKIQGRVVESIEVYNTVPHPFP